MLQQQENEALARLIEYFGENWIFNEPEILLTNHSNSVETFTFSLLKNSSSAFFSAQERMGSAQGPQFFPSSIEEDIHFILSNNPSLLNTVQSIRTILQQKYQFIELNELNQKIVNRLVSLTNTENTVHLKDDQPVKSLPSGK